MKHEVKARNVVNVAYYETGIAKEKDPFSIGETCVVCAHQRPIERLNAVSLASAAFVSLQCSTSVGTKLRLSCIISMVVG